jgi:hypothetical protein
MHLSQFYTTTATNAGPSSRSALLKALQARWDAGEFATRAEFNAEQNAITHGACPLHGLPAPGRDDAGGPICLRCLEEGR